MSLSSYYLFAPWFVSVETILLVWCVHNYISGALLLDMGNDSLITIMINDVKITSRVFYAPLFNALFFI